jgi:hypothetical protein
VSVRTPKPPIPLYWWPFWMLLLVIGLVFFYGIMTPAWIAIRFVAWLSERSPRQRQRARAGAGGAPERQGR